MSLIKKLAVKHQLVNIFKKIYKQNINLKHKEQAKDKLKPKENFVFKFKIVNNILKKLFSNSEISILKDQTTEYNQNQSTWNRFKAEYKVSDFRRERKTEQVQIKEPHIPPNRDWQLTDLGMELQNSTKEKSKQMRFDEDLTSSNKKPNFQFKVSSYNLLAPDLLQDNSYLYSKCKKSYLDWSYRRTKINQQIKNLNSDVGFQQKQNFK